MTKEEIYEKASGIIGINGMTVNERLYESGLMKEFDRTKRHEKKLARTILQALRIDKISIDKML